jgi:hypothetical protein
VSTTIDDDDTTSTSVANTVDATTTSVDDDDDSTSTSVANTVDATTTSVDDDDDSTSTSVANTVDDHGIHDDNTSTSVANTVDDHGGHQGDDGVDDNGVDDHGDDDDNTSTSVATTVEDNDDATSTSVASTTNAPSAPAAFTQSYSSRGGSITVTWNGSSLSLDAINPNAGFVGEVHDATASRVRVDFESNGGSGGDDARIEVRVEDGRVEARVD